MQSELNYPKVLFISNTPFSAINNNGKTYVSLLKGWPETRIAQLYFNESEIPDFTFCNTYYRLTDKQILKGLLNNKKKYCGNSIHFLSPVIQKTTATPKIKPMKDNFGLLFFRDILWGTGIWKTAALKAWLDAFNPEVIFFVGGASGFSYKIANWVQDSCHIPLLIYFTDDYYLNPRISGFIKFVQYYFNTKPAIEKMITRASGHFVIGELMARDYGLQFGKLFIPIMNSVDFEEDEILEKRVNRDNKIFKLAYIGGLHLNRWKGLLNLGEILNEICAAEEINCCLDIYSTDHLTDELQVQLNTSPLFFKGPLNQQQVKLTLKEYDALVHVESDNPDLRRATKYSVSTKIPEYLASKTPIIAFGPNEIASIRIIKDNGIGLVITDLDTHTEKCTKVLNFIKDESMRGKFSELGFRYANENFSNAAMRNKVLHKIQAVFNDFKIQV